MTTIRAHFDGKVFVPHDPVDLPINEPVTLRVMPVAKEEPRMTWEEFEKFMEEDLRNGEGTGNSDLDISRDSIYSGTIEDPR